MNRSWPTWWWDWQRGIRTSPLNTNVTIQETIYAILTAASDLTDLVGGNVYPDTPTANTSLPFVVYWITSSEPQHTLDGPTTLTSYSLSVETFAINLSDVAAIQATTRAALDGYRGGSVQGAFLESEDTSPSDEGFHGQQSFNVWHTRA